MENEQAVEKLTIENFGGIDKAEFTFKPITVLIGPQASGKSVVLKLLYFFRIIFSYEFGLPYFIPFDKDDSTFTKAKERFYSYFPKSLLKFS